MQGQQVPMRKCFRTERQSRLMQTKPSFLPPMELLRGRGTRTSHPFADLDPPSSSSASFRTPPEHTKVPQSKPQAVLKDLSLWARYCLSQYIVHFLLSSMRWNEEHQCFQLCTRSLLRSLEVSLHHFIRRLCADQNIGFIPYIMADMPNLGRLDGRLDFLTDSQLLQYSPSPLQHLPLNTINVRTLQR